jgi:putative transposase
MHNKNYSSDLSLKSWQIIQTCIKIKKKTKWDLLNIVNAILYVTKNGCVWRDLPAEFPPWETVYWYYRKWIKDGTWDTINQSVIIEMRQKQDRKALPSLAIIDSQSVKNSSTATQAIGIDGGKKIKGRKRFYMVDTLGNIVWTEVVAANKYDGTTACGLWDIANMQYPILKDIKTLYADGTFGGTFTQAMQTKYQIQVIIPDTPIAQKGNMPIHEKRWIVERSISWMNNNRRLAKDYERNTDSAKAFITIANIRRTAKHL